MTQHSVRVQEYDKLNPATSREREERQAQRCRQVVGFQGASSSHLAEMINDWVLDNPGWYVEQIHFCGERMNALVQMKKAQS